MTEERKNTVHIRLCSQSSMILLCDLKLKLGFRALHEWRGWVHCENHVRCDFFKAFSVVTEIRFLWVELAVCLPSGLTAIHIWFASSTMYILDDACDMYVNLRKFSICVNARTYCPRL